MTETTELLHSIDLRVAKIETNTEAIKEHLVRLNGAVEANTSRSTANDKALAILGGCVETTNDYVQERQRELHGEQEKQKEQSEKETERTIQGLLRQHGVTIMFLMYLLGLVADFIKDRLP